MVTWYEAQTSTGQLSPLLYFCAYVVALRLKPFVLADTWGIIYIVLFV